MLLIVVGRLCTLLHKVLKIKRIGVILKPKRENAIHSDLLLVALKHDKINNQTNTLTGLQILSQWKKKNSSDSKSKWLKMLPDLSLMNPTVTLNIPPPWSIPPSKSIFLAQNSYQEKLIQNQMSNDKAPPSSALLTYIF